MISVIVPVYNTKKYVKRCVESILSQTYNKFELILVDDGSTDGSGPLLDHLAENNPKISHSQSRPCSRKKLWSLNGKGRIHHIHRLR